MPSRQPKQARFTSLSKQGFEAFQKGSQTDGLNLFIQAQKLLPRNPDANHNLGMAFSLTGHAEKAINHFFKSVEFGRSVDHSVVEIFRLLGNHDVKAANVSISALLKCFRNNKYDLRKLISFSISKLGEIAEFGTAMELSRSGKPEKAAELLLFQKGKKLLNHPLLLEILKGGAIQNIELEKILTEIRKIILLRNPVRNVKDTKLLKFLAALVQQCINNEFVYRVSKSENQIISNLASNISKSLKRNSKLPELFPIYCLYDSSIDFTHNSNLKSMFTNFNHSILRNVVEPYLNEVSAEERFMERINSLTKLSDSSKSVAEQYEENPYPRWHGIAPVHPGAEIDILIEQIGDIARPLKNGMVNVLIAGCGTGKQAIESSIAYGETAQITAIDLSRKSLAYAIRKAEYYGVKNLEFAQADILNLKNVDMRFDVIECTGVLHHLENPNSGWKALSKLLKSDGLMQIAVYRELGRNDIANARREIEKSQIVFSPDALREIRQNFINRQELDWCKRLVNSSDFFTMSECRDLIFNVQEQNYTIPKLKECLDELNFKICGFELPAPHLTRFREQNLGVDWRSPNFLDLWWEFEMNDPTTFPRMYQFWCTRI